MLKRTLEDYKVLLRNIPSTTVTLFVVSVIVMNLREQGAGVASMAGVGLRHHRELGELPLHGHDLQAFRSQRFH